VVSEVGKNCGKWDWDTDGFIFGLGELEYVCV
jgi:hypothetical protein